MYLLHQNSASRYLQTQLQIPLSSGRQLICSKTNQCLFQLILLLMINIFQKELCQALNSHFEAAGHGFDNSNMEAPLSEIDTSSDVKQGFFTIYPSLLL